MSKIDRNKLKRIILQEFKMLGMGNMEHMGMMGGSGAHMSHNPHGCDSCGMSPCGCDEYEDDFMSMPMDNDVDALLPMHTSDHTPMMGSGHGQVSREDCCAAVMCLVECCSCPVTKAALMECCEDIMAGDYDH